MPRKFSERNKEDMVQGTRASDYFKSLPKRKIECLPFEKNERNANILLKELDDIMKKYNVKYYILAGIALGLIRDKKLISWDDDIDLGVYFDSVTQKRACIEELIGRGYQYLDSHGYVPSRLNSYELSIEEYQSISLGMLTSNVGMVEYSFLKRKTIIGIFVITYLPTMGKVIIGKGKRIYPLKFFTNNDIVEYNGIEFNVPYPIEEYLEVVYGKDWRIPIDYGKRHEEDYKNKE